MERMRYIRVPKDIKAMKDYDYGVQKYEQIEELILSESQYSIFFTLKLFRLINDINLIKFKNMLELAIKYRTIVGFDF